MTAKPSEFELARRGYRLTTAQIIYRRPDHPALLQEYLWQEYDLTPHFPVLKGFLRHWVTNLDGRLHSVWVACRGIEGVGMLQILKSEFRLH